MLSSLWLRVFVLDVGLFGLSCYELFIVQMILNAGPLGAGAGEAV